MNQEVGSWSIRDPAVSALPPCGPEIRGGLGLHPFEGVTRRPDIPCDLSKTRGLSLQITHPGCSCICKERQEEWHAYSQWIRRSTRGQSMRALRADYHPLTRQGGQGRRPRSSAVPGSATEENCLDCKLYRLWSRSAGLIGDDGTEQRQSWARTTATHLRAERDHFETTRSIA